MNTKYKKYHELVFKFKKKEICRILGLNIIEDEENIRSHIRCKVPYNKHEIINKINDIDVLFYINHSLILKSFIIYNFMLSRLNTIILKKPDILNQEHNLICTLKIIESAFYHPRYNEFEIESDWWKLLIGLYEPIRIDKNLVISTLNDLDKNQPLFFVLLTIICLNHTKDWLGINPEIEHFINITQTLNLVSKEDDRLDTVDQIKEIWNNMIKYEQTISDIDF